MTCERVAVLCPTVMVVLALVRFTADYTKIQDVIDSTSQGDSVQVSLGTSQENLFISETLTLVEKDKYNTIIDGAGAPW